MRSNNAAVRNRDEEAGKEEARWRKADPNGFMALAKRAPRLYRDLVGVTALKIVCLALIYALFFGASHRLPLDPASRIAGAAVPALTQR